MKIKKAAILECCRLDNKIMMSHCVGVKQTNSHNKE